VIASIAYRRLDEATRRRLHEILKHHPAYAPLWTNRPTNGPDEALNLLQSASIFPDDARSDPWTAYGRSPAHYVNFRVMAEEGNRIEPPLPGENVLNSYVGHVRRARDRRTSLEEKAIDLCWVLHLAGDIHQPLHAVARFSKALPEGDRGGNQVTVPNPRGNFTNLHAYWDDLLGSESDPAAIERLATELMAELPPMQFVEPLRKTGIDDWAEESAALALAAVYAGLDPNVTSVAELPAGYDERSRRVARLRIALAGYRLADQLQMIVDEQDLASDQLTQVSVINALMLGQFDGVMPIGELLTLGDFGLGTLDHLDGELIILDGQAFQVRGDLVVERVGRDRSTPFAVVTPFEADEAWPCPAAASLAELDTRLDERIGRPNQFVAVRIDTPVESIRLRSVPRQEAPYEPLEVVSRRQSVATRQNLRGSLMAVRSPRWAGDLTVPGYHWHFLSDDRKVGGHVLDCTIAEGPGRVRVDVCDSWDIRLPQSPEFNAAGLDVNLKKELLKVEGARGESR
jgi:acetolactate decarboxylase